MRTTLKVLFISLLVSAFSVQVQAQNKIGLGAQLIGPTGITIKADINETFALTGATGFVIQDNFSQLTLQANIVVKDDREELSLESGRLYSYYGGGIEAVFTESFDNRYSIRIPAGIEYEFEENPLGIYMDIAPTLTFQPSTIFYLNGSLGFRYYFN